jgi:hypothetical protein
LGKKTTIIVNDSEGEPIEFETEQEATRVAEMFQNNTTHGSTYEVRFMGDGTSTRT